MTFLSPGKFGKSGPELPTQVKISRTIMTVQAIGLIVGGGIQISGIMQVQDMSDKQLAELSNGTWKSMADVPLTSLWTSAATMLVVGALVGFCAWKLSVRQPKVRIATLVLETLLVLFAVVTLPTGSCFVIFGIPGLAVLVLLFRGPAKSWFAGETPEAAGDKPGE